MIQSGLEDRVHAYVCGPGCSLELCKTEKEECANQIPEYQKFPIPHRYN